jgi:hypothetical protein
VNLVNSNRLLTYPNKTFQLNLSNTLQKLTVVLETLFSMYIIKVKGKAKIPDYIQIRDENFVLVAYFRADRPMKNLEKFGLQGKEEQLEMLINQLPFGKLQKLEL